jgi:hypothetical protein
VSFTATDIAAVYAQDLTPKLAIRPSTALGLYYERPYREYRVFTPAPVLPSPQLRFRLEDDEL